MKIMLFEMKKLWRQKKFLWLFFIVFSYIGTIFLQNQLQHSSMADRALEQVQRLEQETNSIQTALRASLEKEPRDEQETKQLEHVQGMLAAIFQWKASIHNEKWNEIPKYEGDFLGHLQKFVDHGGEFVVMQGEERTTRSKINAWLQKHNLSYEDEEYPISPHLILKNSASIFIGIPGLIMMFLFFGNSLSSEKEQRTWLTLTTQPVSVWKVTTAKYFSVILANTVFLLIVVSVGLVVPMLFNGDNLHLQYPALVVGRENLTVIPVFRYLAHAMVLFICASTFMFSLIFLFSVWTGNTFSTLILTAFVSLMGYFITDSQTILQSPFNPFYHYHMKQIILQSPLKTDFLYLSTAFIWSFIVLFISVLLPEKEREWFYLPAIHRRFHKGKTLNSYLELWDFIIFEWRKLRRRGLLLQTISVLFIFVIFGYFIISQQAYEKELDYIRELKKREYGIEKSMLPMITKTIANFEEEKKLAEKSNDRARIQFQLSQIKLWSQNLEFQQKRLAKLKAALEGYKHGDYTPLHYYQLFELQLANGEFDIASFAGGSWRDQIGQFTVDVSSAEKKWMIKHKVQPLFSGEFTSTIFLKWSIEQHNQIKDDWIEENKKVDNSGLFSLYIYFNNYFYYVSVVLFFLLGGGFAMERGKQATVFFLKTQPISEKNMYLGKIISASAVAVISWAGLVTSVILIGTIANRFGDWYYPVVHYDSESLVSSQRYDGFKPIGLSSGFHLFSLGDYLVRNFILFSFVLVFLIGLSIFLSLFIKKQLNVFAVTIIIVIVGYVGSIKLFPSIAHLSPFIYLNTHKVTNGEISTLLNNSHINFITGNLVLLTSILILIVIGTVYLNIKNK